MISTYLLAINIISLLYFALDKSKAKRGAWRIPELHFFILAALGGAFGIILGMKLFRHKTKHKKFSIGMPLLFLLNLACLLLFLTPITSFSENKTSDFPIKEIRVVLDNNYPPFIMMDEEGNPEGITVDLWRLWEKKTGVKVTLTPMNWSEALSEMEKGKFDVIDTIFENDSRKKIYDFTPSYADIEVNIFFNKNISGITNVKSLKGFSVAAKKGDNAIEVLKNSGIESVVEYDSYESMIIAAKNAEIVVFVMDKPPALYYMYKLGLQDSFKYTAALYQGEFHRGVKKGDQALLTLINNGFDSISDSELKNINNKWYGTTSTLQKWIIDYIAIATFVVFMIIVFLSIWNNTLRKMVDNKTKELINSREKMVAVVEAVPDLIFILDKNGIITDFLSDEVVHKELLVSPEVFIGKSYHHFFEANTAKLFDDAIKQLRSAKEPPIVEYTISHLGGTKHYEARFIEINDQEVMSIVRNVTSKKEADALIYAMSIFDATTGLYNRGYFEKEQAQMSLHQGNNYAFVVCDIDGLKLINDTLGHAEGDNYLLTIADLLKKHFSTSKLIARIGGDEFIVVLENTLLEDFLQMKASLHHHITELNKSRHSFPLSISMGFAIETPNTKSPIELFKEADDFMYREKLYHRQFTRSKSIDLINQMLFHKDFMNEGHGERMKRYAQLFGERLQLNEKNLFDLALLAQYHDVGKIGISDDILKKPGKLNALESSEVKRHAELGFRIAEASPDLISISEWIFKHHEYWDGTGYPFGIKGDEIPLECRILSIIDAYDALTSDRPYRKAIPIEHAINELRRNAGRQFDPLLLEEFIQIIQDKSRESI